MAFLKFMASTAGRTLRVVVGLVLVILAATIGANAAWMYILGIFFIAVGAFDVCVFGPLFKQSLSGKKIRQAK